VENWRLIRALCKPRLASVIRTVVAILCILFWFCWTAGAGCQSRRHGVFSLDEKSSSTSIRGLLDEAISIPVAAFLSARWSLRLLGIRKADQPLPLRVDNPATVCQESAGMKTRSGRAYSAPLQCGTVNNHCTSCSGDSSGRTGSTSGLQSRHTIKDYKL